MFESAVAVGVYHKSENKLSINPKEDVVFGPGDQVVALSNSGKTTPCAPSLLTLFQGLCLLSGLAPCMHLLLTVTAGPKPHKRNLAPCGTRANYALPGQKVCRCAKCPCMHLLLEQRCEHRIM